MPHRLAVIACAVLETEVEHLLRGAEHVEHLEMMQQGLHNDPPRLRGELQLAVDRIEAEHPRVEAIVLVYGLCSRGTEGVRAARCRLVIARAHDCITHLLGSRQAYARYVAEHPGTYWYSPGWNRHHSPPGPERYYRLLAEYRQRFGEDNAEYLMQTEQHWFQTYTRATYVHLTIGATDADTAYTKRCAHWLNWTYDEQAGDPALLRDLLTGPWDDDRFLVLEPGQSLRMTGDDRIIAATPATPATPDDAGADPGATGGLSASAAPAPARPRSAHGATHAPR